MMHVKLKMKIYEKFPSQADFAQAMNVHESTVSQVVRGRRILQESEQRRWAAILDCEPNDVFQNDRN